MLRRILAVTVLIGLSAATAIAQDRQWVRTWEEAQKSRPRSITSTSRIAAAGEPGTPLVIGGRVVGRDGKTPVPDVIVFAYQTDARGVYNHQGKDGWRLRGWARTDAAGKFEFRTIRPASYPSGRIPAHIHLTIEGAGIPRQWTPELWFSDDPFVPAREKERSAAAGSFGQVRTVSTRAGVQHVDFNIRVDGEGRF